MNVFLNDKKLEKVWEAIRKNFFPVPPESGTAQPPTPAMEGDVTIAFGRFTSGDYIGYLNSIVSTIGDKKVTTAKIDDAAVTTIKLADDAIETAKIKNLAVSTAKIADSAITQAKLALGAIAPTVIWTPGTSNGPTLTIQAGKDTSTAVAIPKASATASGVVTTAAQSFAGDKTFEGEVYGEKNIQAMRGVAAGGYADLSMSSGGGSGTVVAIYVNGVTKEPVAGLITLDDYPLLSVYNSDKTGILNRLTVIEGKIPADASSSNKLADKAFVNSSINTATATHQGTYDVVNDLHLTASATHEQVAAALLTAVASRNPDKNDYVFVSFPATASAAGRFDRYKYDGTAWGYEYTLNNSSFTSAQWAAITSGITPELVAAFNAKYDKPSGGIPKSDLASDVQTSLGKADTALQTHQTIYDLVIQKNGVKVGNTYNPATGDQIINITDVASDADVTTLKGYFTNGVAKNAARLSNTAKIGDTNKPVYFTANGVPTPISYTIGRNVAANEDVTPYTAGDSIDITGHVVKVLMTASDSPSASGNAIAFIDTISQNAAGKITATKKTIHTASATQLGLVKVGTGLSISEGVLSIGTGGVTNAMLANSKITIGTREVSLGGTLAMSTLASDVSTQLGLKSAALHEHGDYVTALGVDGKTLTWSKGGTAQDALTIPYAKESTTLETETMPETQEFIFRNSPKTIGADSIKLDRILGRTLVWNQLEDYTRIRTYSSAGLTITNNNDGSFSVDGTATGTVYSLREVSVDMSLPKGHKILAKGSPIGASSAETLGSLTTYGMMFQLTNGSGTEGLVPPSGKIFNLSFDGGIYALKIAAKEGTEVHAKFRPLLFDLTLMFGEGNEPSTVAEFEALYPNAYYEYNAGQLINNSAEGLETVGFNLYGGKLEFGNLDPDPQGTSNNYIRTTEYVSAFDGQYYFKWVNVPQRGSDYQLYGLFYDGGKNIISRSQLSAASSTTEILGTAPVGTRYIKAFIYSLTGFSSAELKSIEFCLNKSDTSKNGQYEPYKRNVLDLHLENIQVKSPNIWDEEWEAGALNTSNGATINSPEQIRSKNYIPILPNQTYFVKGTTSTGAWVALYDSNKTIIPLLGWSGGSSTSGNMRYCFNSNFFSAPNAAYAKFYLITSYGATYNNDICINVSDPGFNGKYFPHGVLTFNGLNNSRTKYDDVSQQEYHRQFHKVVFTGNETYWEYTSSVFRTTGAIFNEHPMPNFHAIQVAPGSPSTRGNGIASHFGQNTPGIGIAPSGAWDLTGDTWGITFARDIIPSLASSTNVADWKTWLAAQYAAGTPLTIIYELATPETYDLVAPIPTAMPAGTTERRLPEDTSDSVLAPFACDMTYGTNPGDILASGIAWEKIWGKPHTLAELGLDDMFIKHDKSNQSLTKLDRHLIKVGDQDLYLIFNAEADGSFTLRVATGLNNGTYENEQAFSLSTITDEQINAICHL